MAKRPARSPRANGADAGRSAGAARSTSSADVATSMQESATAIANAVSTPEGWVGLTRDQLELAMQSTTAFLRSVEALRKVQWDMTHLAVQRHQELQQRLHEVKELSDLVALEVDLMRFDSAAAMRSAQELYDAAVRSATEAFESARTTLDASRNDGLKTWMQSMQSMVHTGVRPLDDVYGNLWWRPLASAQSGEQRGERSTGA